MFSGLKYLKNITTSAVEHTVVTDSTSTNVDIKDATIATEHHVPTVTEPNRNDTTMDGSAPVRPQQPTNKFRVIVSEDGSRNIDVYIYQPWGMNWNKFLAKVIAALRLATAKDNININLGYHMDDGDIFETITLINAINTSRTIVSVRVANIDSFSKLVLLLVSNKPVVTPIQRVKLTSIDAFAYGGSELDFKVSKDKENDIRSYLYSIVLTSGFMSKEELDNLVHENGLFSMFGNELGERLVSAIQTLHDKDAEHLTYTI